MLQVNPTRPWTINYFKLIYVQYISKLYSYVYLLIFANVSSKLLEKFNHIIQ